MTVEALEQRGFAIARRLIAPGDLDAVAATLTAQIREEANRAGGAARTRVADLDDAQVPHAGLLALRDAHSAHMALAVDRAKISPAVQRVLCCSAIQELAASLLHVPPAWVGLSHPNLRADLPDEYTRERTAFSLPWHQEGAYFDRSVSRGSSLVFWIALDDCGREDGCLEVLEGSHRLGLVAHGQTYRDPVNGRHLRFETDSAACADHSSAYCETERGDVGVIHFCTIHRSGRNNSDKVRYTLLIRASNVFADDFKT